MNKTKSTENNQINPIQFKTLAEDAPMHVLQDRAEFIRENIKKLKINYNNETLENITVSIGIAAAPLHGDTQKMLIKTADTALYEAKETGRDKVIVAKPLNNRSEDREQEHLKIAK